MTGLFSIISDMCCSDEQHGSKASTSKSGSADFLVELGIPITTLPPSALPHQSPFLFLFAFLYHPTFSITSPVRKELPFPTIYNLLGPLINPAKPDVMVLGVYDKKLGPVFSQALKSSGVTGWVVSGAEGLDEISPAGLTYVCPFLSMRWINADRIGTGLGSDETRHRRKDCFTI